VVVFAFEVMRQSHEVLLSGGRIGLFSGSLARLLDDCQCLRPTVFAATPSFWNGLYAQYEHELASEVAASQLSPEDDKTRATIALVTSRVLDKWRERRILGNKITVLISTGAPLAHRIYRWLYRVVGRLVINGFGCTETGGLCSNGAVADGVEVTEGPRACLCVPARTRTYTADLFVQLRLLDCPQLGYTTADQPHPRGEILARTPRMSVGGYFHRARYNEVDGTLNSSTVETNEAGGDGEEDWITISGVRYFRTGDIGELLGVGQMKVIDRCKAHLKLAQGIFVAPEPLELQLASSKYVKQIWVWGEGYMRCVVAVVVPDVTMLLAELGTEDTNADGSVVLNGAQREQAERLVLSSLRQVGTELSFKPWEIPQRVVLEMEAFTAERGLLTSIGKHCRPALITRYRDCLRDDSVGGEAGVAAVGQMPPVYKRSRTDGKCLCAGLVAVLREVTALPKGAPDPEPEESLLALGLDSLAVSLFMVVVL
jgi:long-chain acyl-CoA synthetase